MKFASTLAALLGVFSFAHALERADAAIMVNSILENVDFDGENPDATVLYAANDNIPSKRAEAADKPRPTRDTTVCPDFGMRKCAFHCVTAVLSHITSCVAANDVHCLCHHQSEVKHAAAKCVYEACGSSRTRVFEILEEGRKNCKAYRACSKHAPKATAYHVSGVNNKGAEATGTPTYPTFYPT